MTNDMINGISNSRDQYSSKEIADMVNAVLSFDNKKIIEPIKNALYTKPLKADSVSLSGLDIATDPFDFVLKFISLNNSSELYDVESESYGVLYKYIRDNYIDSPSKKIIENENIDTGTRRYYSLQDYMITPVISYYGGPVASMRTPDNAHISDKDIILKYKEILYSLRENLENIVNIDLKDSFLRDLILPFIVENPNSLSMDRELSKYNNSLLMTLDKSLIYGDDRDNMLLSILNSSYNYFGSANLDSNIDYFSRKIAVDAISDYASYFGERGDDLKNVLSSMWSSIEYSAKKISSDTISYFVGCFGEKDSKLKTMLSNILSNITLNPIRYDIDYYYPNSESNDLIFFIDGTQVSPNDPHWKYINIISGNTYYGNYVKKLDSGETVYKSKIYVKNTNGEYTVVKSFTGGIPDSIDDLNKIISDGTEIYVRILSDISIKIRDDYFIKYELSNDNEKYLINFETLNKNFFEIILECYNNSVLDTNKLADGYGTYSSYLDLLKMVSSDDYLFNNLSKIRLSEFIYILKDFYKIVENDPYIEALESKLRKYYNQCSYIKNAYRIILDKFNEYPQYFKCIKI